MVRSDCRRCCEALYLFICSLQARAFGWLQASRKGGRFVAGGTPGSGWLHATSANHEPQAKAETLLTAASLIHNGPFKYLCLTPSQSKQKPTTQP